MYALIETLELVEREVEKRPERKVWKPIKFKKQKVTIKTPREGYPDIVDEQALVAGSWAIHRERNSKRYGITFLPSGHSLIHGVRKLSEAKAILAEAVEAVPGLLFMKRLEQVEKVLERLRDIVTTARDLWVEGLDSDLFSELFG